MQHWEICLFDPEAPALSFPLQEGSLLLGTAPECAISSTALGVAPRHAEFFVSLGKLHLRALSAAPPILLDGAPVHGTVELTCPATLDLASLRITVKEAKGAGEPQGHPDSTLRIVHPAGQNSFQAPDTQDFDVTGRIVYPLPDTGDAANLSTVLSQRTSVRFTQATAFSDESTMAFSMKSSDFEMDDTLPVRTHYLVRSEIARGGMGKIYSAEDAELDRIVALKVSTLGERAKDLLFFQEAKTLAALEHPNIVPVHNTGVDSAGRPFYSMKRVHGRTLQWIIKQLVAGDRQTAENYTNARLIGIFRKVCDAVAFAHAKGYLHRDLKPENIMVGEFGEVLVMDWGIAKKIRTDRTDRTDSQDAAPDAEEPETLPYIEGTPQYMSPEQANGLYGGLDERSDVYSLGGVLYAILTLRPPVSGSSLQEVLDKVRNGETTTMALPRGVVKSEAPAARLVPSALRAVTLKALARDRAKRYQSVRELESDIEAYQNGFPTRAEEASFARHMVLLMRRHRLASALTGLLLVAALAFTVRLAESERNAHASARSAALAAARADADSKRAQENAARAEKNEQEAAQKSEAFRRERSRAQIALAEAAEKAQNAGDIMEVLRNVPEDLRDQQWEYLSRITNSEDSSIELKESESWQAVQPHPKDPDIVFVLHSDGAIRALNLKTGATEDVFLSKLGNLVFKSFAISPNTELAAVFTFDRKEQRMQVRVLDLNSKTLKTHFDFPEGGRGQHCLQFNRNSTLLLASGVAPSQFCILDIANETIRWPDWKEPKNGMARLSEDERSVILRLTGQLPVEFSLADEALKPVPFKEGFKLLGGLGPESYQYSTKEDRVFTLNNGILRRFDTQSGQKAFDARLPNGAWQAGRVHPSKLAAFPELNLAVSLTEVSDDSAVVLLHEGSEGRVTQTRLVKIEKSAGPDWQLWIHPLSKRIAVVRGKTMKTWSLSQPVPAAEFTVLPEVVQTGFSFLHSPAKVITVADVKVDSDKTEALFKILDLGPDKKEVPFHLLLPHKANRYISLTQSLDGKWLGAKFDGPGPFYIWDIADGKFREVQRLELSDRNWDLRFIRFSPSGRLLWTSNGTLDVASGKYIKNLRIKGTAHPVERQSPVWLGESRMAQIRIMPADKTNHSENNRAILGWDVESGQQTEPELAPDALALDASPDGTQLAEGGSDMRVRLRDATTLKVQKTLRVHDGSVTQVAWHPFLPLLATASTDFSVKIWDLQTERVVEEYRYCLGTSPSRIIWSPDGRRLAISDTGGNPNVKVYEPKACRPEGK